MASEKRQSVRQPYSKKVEFETMIAGAKKAGTTRHHAQCLNISEGGLGVNTEFHAKEGEVFKLSMPLNKNVSVPVFAEVVWKKSEADCVRAGMRFLA